MTLGILLLLVKIGTSDKPYVQAWHFLQHLALQHLAAVDNPLDSDVNGKDQCCQKCRVQLQLYGYKASLPAVSNESCVGADDTKPQQCPTLQEQGCLGLENHLRCMICKGPTDTLVRLAAQPLLKKMQQLVWDNRDVECPTNDLQASCCCHISKAFHCHDQNHLESWPAC